LCFEGGAWVPLKKDNKISDNNKSAQSDNKKHAQNTNLAHENFLFQAFQRRLFYKGLYQNREGLIFKTPSGKSESKPSNG
jgi:transcriptional regulator of met regulon